MIEKPSNLIGEEVMTSIYYDLTVLDAIRSQNPYSPDSQAINAKDYIYKKYKIDSLQFTQSNRFYVSQIDLYRNMYQKISDRIDDEKKNTDSLVKLRGIKKAPSTLNSDKPQIQ